MSDSSQDKSWESSTKLTAGTVLRVLAISSLLPPTNTIGIWRPATAPSADSFTTVQPDFRKRPAVGSAEAGSQLTRNTRLAWLAFPQVIHSTSRGQSRNLLQTAGSASSR